MAPGPETKYSFSLIERRKTATSKWSNAKQFIEMKFESWTGPVGSGVWLPSWLEEGALQGHQGRVVCSQAPDLSPQVQHSPWDTTPLPGQPRCSEVSPDLAQRGQTIQSIDFKLRVYHVRSRARQGSKTMGTKIKKNISSHQKLSICSRRYDMYARN